MTFLVRLNSPKFGYTQNRSGGKIINFQQSQALTSHFESFWSIVYYKPHQTLILLMVFRNRAARFYVRCLTNERPTIDHGIQQYTYYVCTIRTNFFNNTYITDYGWRQRCLEGYSQRGNFMIFLSLRFSVKSSLAILEVQNMPFELNQRL